jgi:hypothetical protein
VVVEGVILLIIKDLELYFPTVYPLLGYSIFLIFMPLLWTPTAGIFALLFLMSSILTPGMPSLGNLLSSGLE